MIIFLFLKKLNQVSLWFWMSQMGIKVDDLSS